MPYNLDIPGQISIYQMKAIEAVASLVPKNGQVVEVGSLFGSSSWVWAKSVDPSVTVNCIDPWEGNEGIRALERQYGVTYGIEQFKKYVADCDNIKARQGYSPRDFKDWNEPIDLYYEDAVHTNPILAQNLKFWSDHIKPTGIICGDDYRPRFKDVRDGAAKLAKQYKRELITVDFFWCLLPDEKLVPGANKVAKTLKALSKASDKEVAARKRKFGIGPYNMPREFQAGASDIEIKCRVDNLGHTPWPSDARKKSYVGVHIVNLSDPKQDVIEVLEAAPFKKLEFDIPNDYTITLPISELKPGTYKVVFDLADHNKNWILHKDLSKSNGLEFSVLAAGQKLGAPIVKPVSRAKNNTQNSILRPEDVIQAYRWILGREPESFEKIEAHLSSGDQTVKSLRKKFMSSPEFERQFNTLQDLLKK